ncbi:MAG: sodium-dependent transporter [Verrucomicrobia bacterium]|nr:sodium-dependent transporter [Verrucomicrobiota bacterium]
MQSTSEGVTTASTRGQWGSKLGFILAAAGSAVGLGNIWRFPYLTGENGGAAFVVVYLLCVLLIGLPLMFNELALGRRSGKDVIGAFRVTKPGTPFVITGVFCLACCFFVLSYYAVIAGWTVGYAIASLLHTKVEFERFAARPEFVLPLFGFFILMTILIVQGGVEKGIEKWSKVLMPVLIVLCGVVIIRSVTLEGAGAGIKYYLHPDFSKINGDVVMKALGQAFFSLSVGWGLMITYGSYMSKRQDIVTGGIWVAGMDTFVAIMGGFMVFPAVFAFGLAPDAGTALTFKTLPSVFEQMPAGQLVGAAFFLLLGIAALTSTISMLEVPVAWLVDEKKWGRKRSAWLVGGAAFVVGLPSALSVGGVEWLTKVQFLGKTGFLDIMDHIFGTAIILLICLLCSVYVGWSWGPKHAVEEMSSSNSWFARPLLAGLSPATVWVWFIRIVCPLIVSLMLLNMFGVKFF